MSLVESGGGGGGAGDPPMKDITMKQLKLNMNFCYWNIRGEGSLFL